MSPSPTPSAPATMFSGPMTGAKMSAKDAREPSAEVIPRSSGDATLNLLERSLTALQDPGFPIAPEIMTITGITDAMVASHSIDDAAVTDLLGRVVLVIAHNADFDRRFLERRLPVFATKHWACSRSDIDWKAEGLRSSALEFVAYSLGFFHDGHRAASDCRATLHALAQPLPGTGRLALQALLEQARLPTWRLWARDAAIERKDLLKPEVTPGALGL